VLCLTDILTAQPQASSQVQTVCGGQFCQSSWTDTAESCCICQLPQPDRYQRRLVTHHQHLLLVNMNN